MRRIGLAVLVMVLIPVTGCVKLVHPVFGESERIRDNRITGFWVTGRDTIAITEDVMFAEGDYTAAGREDEDGYGIYLGRIGDRTFADVFPESGFIPPSSHLPLHHLVRVWISSDTLRVAHLNPAWLEEYLNDGALRYLEAGGQKIVIASGEDVRRFLARNFTDQPEALRTPEVYVRSKTRPAMPGE